MVWFLGFYSKPVTKKCNIFFFLDDAVLSINVKKLNMNNQDVFSVPWGGDGDHF